MAAGIWNPGQRVLDASTLSRILNNGDKIIMTISNFDTITNATQINGLITYAVKFN